MPRRVVRASIVLRTSLEIGRTRGVVESLCSFMLPSDSPVSLTFELVTALKEVLKFMKLITHPDGVLASCLVAGHQANASIRGHADTVKVMIAEVLKMRLPGGRLAG